MAALGEVAIVRGHQESYVFSGDEVEQEIEDHGAVFLVERSGGLIGEEDFGPVHEGAAECGALTLAAGELLDALVEAMGQAGSLSEFHEASLGDATVNAGGNGGDETVLSEGEIGNEIVKLKDEADLVAEQAEKIAMAIDFNSVDEDAAAIGLIETAEEMEERAFAAARRAAESDGLAFDGFEVYAFQDRDGAVVVALPQVLSLENDAALGVGLG